MNAVIRRVQNFDDWTIFYILIVITLASSVGSAIMNIGGADNLWWSGWLQNFSTEMMGAIATFALFELVVSGRREREAKKEAIVEKIQNLIIQMRSKDNATAITALEQLRANNWLKDDPLQGVNLSHANLQSSNLRGTNLQSAQLDEIRLQEAQLYRANLKEANLQEANLQEAQLQSAILIGANLRGANLQSANLVGANFQGANLEGANLENTKFDKNTVLPDAKHRPVNDKISLIYDKYDKYWTRRTDMSRYTDKEHYDFWKAPERQ